MHDIVHDFAQFLTNTECIAMKDKDFGESSTHVSFDKAHHLMLMVDKNSSFPISICNIKKLRSLLIKFKLGMDSVDGVLIKLLGENTCLRALAFGGSINNIPMSRFRYSNFITFEKLPREIRKLKHLRYLDISENKGLEMLPDILCELYNLQTLNVDDCENLKELPRGIGKLINLRHLLNSNTDSLRCMPKGIQKLTCLRTLTQFQVSEDGYGSKACSLECLNKFPHLQGLFKIIGLGNLRNVSEVHTVQLRNKSNISTLVLDFSGSNSVINEAILEALQPPPNLQGLAINRYADNVELPNWTTSLVNLRRLHLEGWIKCEQLPPLGRLPSLESLIIGKMKRVKRVRNELLGLESGDITSSLSITAFSKLEYLSFWDMEEWEKWDFGIEHHNIKIMPSLHTLEIRECPKLKVFPKQILQAPLQVLRMEQSRILIERYRKGIGRNWSDISHIPNIEIDGVYLQRDGR